MSLSLLVRQNAVAKPFLIVREKATITSMRTVMHKVRSRDVPRLYNFDRETFVVRKGALTDPPHPDENSVLILNGSSVELSIRASLLMFLTVSFRPGAPLKLVITSRIDDEVLARISTYLKMIFERLEVLIYTGAALDELYAKLEATSERAREDPNTVLCLAALGNTLAKHVILTNYFQPHFSLYGIRPSRMCDFRFYAGEMWLLPFPDTKIMSLYLYTAHRLEKTITDPVRNGIFWDSTSLYDAAWRHARVKNELDVYFDPETGSNRYIMSKFPNDFSHMYVYFAAFTLLLRLRTPLSRDILTAMLNDATTL